MGSVEIRVPSALRAKRRQDASRTQGLKDSRTPSNGRVRTVFLSNLTVAFVLCGWMSDTTTNASQTFMRSQPRTLSEALMAHLPRGSRALTPCETTMDAKTHELRCLHQHVGKHLRTTPGASVTLLPSGLAHVVESCGAHTENHSDTASTCDGEDPYVLWYVMAIRGANGTAATGPFACNPSAPYMAGTHPAGTPNPNNPDPSGAQPLVTRHWPAGVTVPYVINTAMGITSTVNLFQLPLPQVSAINYARATFALDITALMSNAVGVGAIPTAAVPPTQAITYPYPAPDYDAIGYTNIIAPSGQFIWGIGGCFGPTGNGLNEFIFLQNSTLSTLPGGVAGGLTSMLLDPQTGVITECDVVFAVGPYPNIWSGVEQKSCTGLAHEVGHFWGLDHTNLHPGGTALQPVPLPGAPATLGGTYSSSSALSAVPAMVSQYADSWPANRVANYSSAWRPDDIAAFSSLYPVNTISGSKLPMINTSAVITGKVIDSGGVYDGAGVFGMNAYLVEDFPALNPPISSTVNSPVVGTVTGVARPDSYAITGRLDTATGAPCSGDFRIDGVPALYGGTLNYTLYIEPLGSLNLAPGNFSEWWIEPHFNPALNALGTAPVSVGYRGNGQFYSGALPVSSMSVTAGTILQLESTIDIQASVPLPFQICNVSRPLVHVSPRAARPSIGGTISITVEHNKTACTSAVPMAGKPLQSITCTWNGSSVPVALTSTNQALPLPIPMTTPIMTQATVTVPSWATFPAVVEVLVLEVLGAPGSPPSVLGRNVVMY